VGSLLMFPFARDTFQVTWPAQQGQSRKSRAHYLILLKVAKGAQPLLRRTPTAGSMSNSLRS